MYETNGEISANSFHLANDMAIFQITKLPISVNFKTRKLSVKQSWRNYFCYGIFGRLADYLFNICIIF